MTTTKNLAASVHQRLLNQARADRRPFDELLQYYAIERFLYRLSVSPYREVFVLKGALMFLAWGGPLSRATRDMDLLAYTDNTVDPIVGLTRTICAQLVEPDGMVYDTDSIVGEVIREQADYQGVRVRWRGWLGPARATLQMDLGFADVVTPAPIEVEYPSLLNMPRPKLRGYSREAMIAEKTQALVALGLNNSRMKDFYDLWLLSSSNAFEGPLLAQAIAQTFARRQTVLPITLPDALQDEFGARQQALWKAFLDTSRITLAPNQLQLVLVQLRKFLGPVLAGAKDPSGFGVHWQAGSEWA